MKINKAIILFLFIMFVDLLSITMGNIFINIFLMRISDDFANVLMFNAISFAFISVSGLMLGRLSKKVSKKIGIIFGNILSIVMYLMVILLQEQVNGYILLLAVLSGISQGFYWLSMNTLLLELADETYRKRLNSWNGSINSLCQLSAPLLASFIVGSFPLMLGYQVLFTLIIILMIISIIACISLKTKHSSQPYSIRDCIKKEHFSHYLHTCKLCAQVFFRDGAIPSLLNVLIFEVVRNEKELSLYLSFMTLMAMIVYYALSHIHVDHRKLFNFGTILCGISMMILMNGLDNEFMIILFVILFGIGSPICLYQMHVVSQNVAYKMDKSCAYSLEFTIIKEVFTGIGRVSACVLLYVLYIVPFDFSMFWIFAFIALLISLCSIYTYHSIMKEDIHVSI